MTSPTLPLNNRPQWGSHSRLSASLGLVAVLAGCVTAPLPPPPSRSAGTAPVAPPAPSSTAPAAAPPVAAAPMALPPPPQSPLTAQALPPPIAAPGGPSGAASAGPYSTATPVYFYPERAQGEAQQDRDRYECYRWAVRESGSDPGMTTVRQPLMPSTIPGERLRDGSGVVTGALTGAVIGAAVSSPRQTGANAIIGAIFGAALGGAAQESRAQAIESSQARRQQAAAAVAESARIPQDNFRRAMSACMQGRGYRIG